MEDFLSRLVSFMSLSEEEFAFRTREPSFSDLPALAGEAVTKARSRIRKAAKQHEAVFVYGDYDCDGIMATSIMVRALAEIGIRASYCIPSRYEDGYGLHLAAAKQIAAEGFTLLLTVDNGVTAFEPIRYLREAGVDVIVLDHHEIGPALPEANLVLHPDLLSLPGPSISAGELCFLFSRVLLARDDPYLACLGALSAISDCMELVSYNQKLVALCLRFLRKYRFETICGLTAEARIDETTIGMEIIPQINAVGRVEMHREGERLIPYFAFEQNKESTRRYLKEINESRKKITKDAYASLSCDETLPGIFVETDLLEGLNGLLANKLLNVYRRPIAVFSPSKEDPSVLVGSLRGKKGFSFIEFLSGLGDLPLRGGGHELAGGMSVPKAAIKDVESAFYAYCAAHPCVEEEAAAMDISLEEVSLDSFRALRLLGPFGHQNEAPRFRLPALKASTLRYSRDGNHLMHFLPSGGKILAFHQGEALRSLGEDFVALEGRFAFDAYRGKASVAFHVDKIVHLPVAES